MPSSIPQSHQQENTCIVVCLLDIEWGRYPTLCSCLPIHLREFWRHKCPRHDDHNLIKKQCRWKYAVPQQKSHDSLNLPTHFHHIPDVFGDLSAKVPVMNAYNMIAAYRFAWRSLIASMSRHEWLAIMRECLTRTRERAGPDSWREIGKFASILTYAVNHNANITNRIQDCPFAPHTPSNR